MAQAKVAIRLGTEGKEQIVRDFAEVGAAGDAAANRAAKSFERASQDMESAARRQAAAQAKIVAMMPADRQANVSLSSEQAGPSTAMFTAARREQALLEQQAIALRAAIDPAWAAQQRFNAEMGAARTLVAANVITLDDYCAKLRIEQGLLNQVSNSHVGGTVSAGQYKAGVQQLGFQMQDLGVQMAMAAGSGNVVKGVMTGLAMQGPQVVSAIAMMRGSAGGFLGWLAGPWGAGVMAATSVLAVLGAEFLGSGDDAEKAAGKIDRYTAALNRMVQASGRATAAQIGENKVRLAQLQGWRANPDRDPDAPKGGNRAGDIARALRRRELDGQISNLEASIAGVEMAVASQKKLDVLGVQDKAGAKAASEAARAAKAAQREREREAERAREEAARQALRVRTENNAWANSYDPGKGAIEALTKEGEKLAENQRIMTQMRADTAAGTALLNVEWQLRGKSRDIIEDALELRRYQMDLERQFPAATAEQVAELTAAYQAQQQQNAALREFGRNWQEITQYGEHFVDMVLDPTAWSDFGDMGKAVLRDLAMEMWKLAAINPLKNALFGSSLPGIGGLFSSLLGGASGGLGGSSLAPAGTYMAAIGSEYTPGGRMLVGENGPEIVDMPRGAKVMTASDTRRAMGGGRVSINPTVHISIDATGADAAGLARVEAQLAQMRSDLPGTIVSTVSEAQDRLVLRGGY